MKNILMASIIAGVTVSVLLFFLRGQSAEKKTADAIGDAADDAYNTMSKYIRSEEAAFDPALN